MNKGMPDLARADLSCSDLSWVNGKNQSVIALTDRGLQYGDGLFETILYLNGKLVLEKEHLSRLQRDCLRLRINLDTKRLRLELDAFIKQLVVRGASRGILKILVTREFTRRGYTPDTQAGSFRLLQFFSGISYPKTYRRGVALALFPQRLSINPALAGMKHLNRLEQVLAQAQLPKNYRGLDQVEGLLLDTQQAVTEGIHSNIFMLRQGILYTPPLDRCGVQGVMRDFILRKLSKSLGLAAQEQRISLPELLQADEVFICNSVYGLWPVTALEVKSYPLGQITRALQTGVDELGYGALYD